MSSKRKFFISLGVGAKLYRTIGKQCSVGCQTGFLYVSRGSIFSKTFVVEEAKTRKSSRTISKSFLYNWRQDLNKLSKLRSGYPEEVFVE